MQAETANQGALYIGLARTKVRGRWATLRVAASQVLVSNKEWRIILDDVLNEFADADQEMDVFLHINNPGNLIQTLVFGMPDKIADYEPIIWCTATRQDGWMFTLNGRLTWNGKPTENLLRPLRQACGVVSQSWMINSNDWWLLGSLGLHYTAQLAVIPPGPDAEPVPGPIFIAIDDTVHTVHEPEDLAAAGWRDYLSLDTFVARYRHQVQLFVNEQRRCIDMPLLRMRRCAAIDRADGHETVRAIAWQIPRRTNDRQMQPDRSQVLDLIRSEGSTYGYREGGVERRLPSGAVVVARNQQVIVQLWAE